MHRPVFALALALSACGGDKSDTAKIGTTAVDTGSGSEEITAVYPTESMNRMLLYYGSGGFSPSGSTGVFDDVDTYVKDTHGWNTDHRTDWTSDLSTYRVIGLVALGHDGGDNLDDSQLEDLRTALAAGSRVVFFGHRESCDSAVMADAISALGVSMSFTGTSADANMRIDATELAAGQQLTEGVEKVIFKEPCWVNSGGGNAVVTHIGNVVAGVARPATGGDVLLVGDFQFMDDSGYLLDEAASNAQFVSNLVKVDPSL